MRSLSTFILFSLFVSFSFAQQYSKVQIHLPDDAALAKLGGLSIAADHGSWRGTSLFETDLRADEIDMIKDAGLQVEILIEDVSAYYAKRSEETAGNEKSAADDCNDANIEITTPNGFSLGGQGGYFTYAEFLGHLDNMATLYPDLITAKQPIGTFETFEQRPIYWVRISDNATQNENETQVLYTSLHHAREPVSLSQLIFYMYYVLENYASDPAVKQLVDNTEMYFIPMVNPDGYIYNQSTNPNGGGMWRKNRRDNGGGIFGVDLNRNYSYEWGTSGTSNNPDSEVYKGTAPMSEPETQAMEWFTQQHEFVSALNHHAYADQLLFPWGYADNVQTPDHEEFTAISAEMVSQNGYLNQQSALLYPAAGDSDDWGYGETGTKPRIYSMTSEVGGNSDGFWPPQSRIIPLCKENVYLNLTLARSALNFGKLKDLEPVLQSTSGAFSYSLQRLGWQSGLFSVSIEPLQGISSVGAANSHSVSDVAETVEDSIAFILESGLTTGDPIVYVLTLDNGIYLTRDTVSKVFGSIVPLFENAGSPSSDWDSNNTWAVTTVSFVSSPDSWTDSPNTDYPNNSTRTMETVEAIDLTDQSDAFLRFFAKWEIESGWDYAQVSASTNGSTWIPLCGNYTVTGNENQDEGEPIYEGMQSDWVQEEISLADFIGESIYLRFRLVSDNFVREDGIYIDDLQVIGTSELVSSTTELTESDFSVYPNPNNGQFYLMLKKEAQISVYSSNGQLMVQTSLTTGKYEMDGSTWAQGLYIVKMETVDGVFTERLVVR